MLKQQTQSDSPFTRWEAAPGLWAILCPGYMPGPGRLPGYGRTLVYLVIGQEKALLFDTGFGNADLKGYVETITDLPLIVLNSHAHIDHLGGNAQFDTVYLGEHELDSTAPILLQDDQTPHPRCPLVKAAGSYRFVLLQDGQQLKLGGRTATVVEIPGHTRGSIAILDSASGVLLSGDAILKRVLLLGKVPLRVYRENLARVDRMEFSDIWGSHWPEALGRDFIKKMLNLFDSFDQQKVELSPWKVEQTDFAVFAHGNAFEERDFCALGYPAKDADILFGPQ